MRHGASVWRRTEKLAASLKAVALQRELAGQEVAVRQAVERVAAAVGVEPAEVLTEAQTLLMQARAMGARTDAEVVAFVVREQGMSEEELQAEVAR